MRLTRRQRALLRRCNATSGYLTARPSADLQRLYNLDLVYAEYEDYSRTKSFRTHKRYKATAVGEELLLRLSYNGGYDFEVVALQKISLRLEKHKAAVDGFLAGCQFRLNELCHDKRHSP